MIASIQIALSPNLQYTITFNMLSLDGAHQLPLFRTFRGNIAYGKVRRIQSRVTHF